MVLTPSAARAAEELPFEQIRLVNVTSYLGLGFV
jgi:hypothetical protein